MSPETIGIIGTIILFLFMFLGMHIGVAMGITGLLGAIYVYGIGPAVNMVVLNSFTSTASYLMILIPLFLLMGELAIVSGLAEEAYYAMQKLIGHLPGGLAMATIGGCAGFAAVCGTSVGNAAIMTTVSLPEMLKRNYAPGMSAAVIAAGGTLGILIPPSMAFVLYGLISEQSIGKLLISGILPGILLAGLFMLTIYIIAARNPSEYPPGPKASWRERAVAIRNSWGVLLLFLLVIGSIYSGVCTATEAASVGVFVAFLIALAKRKLSMQLMSRSLMSTLQNTGMIFIMVIGANIFGVFFAVSNLPTALVNLVAAYDLPPLVVMTFIIILFFILGCIMDSYCAMLLVAPALIPVVSHLGFDLIWFGVIMVIMVEMGLITPPVGMNVFVLAGMAKGVPLYVIFRGIWPFVLDMAVCIILLTAFPIIALFLPGL